MTDHVNLTISWNYTRNGFACASSGYKFVEQLLYISNCNSEGGIECRWYGELLRGTSELKYINQHVKKTASHISARVMLTGSKGEDLPDSRTFLVCRASPSACVTRSLPRNHGYSALLNRSYSIPKYSTEDTIYLASFTHSCWQSGMTNEPSLLITNHTL